MYQQRAGIRKPKRGAESGFWRGTTGRSFVMCCVALGIAHLASPWAAAQYGGVPTKAPVAPFGNQPSKGGQYTTPSQYPPLPSAPAAAQAFPPVPQMQQFPPVPQMQQFPPVPTFPPPAQNVVQAQAVQEPPMAKQPEKIGQADNLPPPRPVQSPFGPAQVRMPLMSPEGVPLLGTTPAPTAQTIEQFKKYIERFVDPQNTLDLVQSRVRLIVLKTPPKRIQMGDESIAVYNLISPTEITMIGRAAGSTVLNMWFIDENGKEIILSYLVRVFPDPEEKERLERVYKALELEINRVFPLSVVHLRLVGDKIVVTGQAHDSIDATQIIRLIRTNSPNAAQNPNIPVDAIFPFVRPTDPNNAVPGLENYGLHSTAQIINMLRVPGEQQIMLKVTVAEVNRTAARSIGLNFTLTNNNGLQYLANLTGGIAPGNIPVLLDNGQISLAINALKGLNYARALAEPNLVTLNGMPANFQAGGSFPVPITTAGAGVGLQGTTFVPFGVQLNFTPYLTDKDRVRLAVNATVSTRDNTAATNIGGANVPGLNSRSFATTVELREGQTMAVAGLIQNNLGADRVNVPFFADIPVINRLTGLDKTSYGEQELVILVTPEIIHPMEYKEVPPLPGSDIFEPTDCEFYLLGRLESRRAYDYRSSVMNDLARQKRSHNCEQLYIFGQVGHSLGGGMVGDGGPGFNGPGPNGGPGLNGGSGYNGVPAIAPPAITPPPVPQPDYRP
jgi:pilus assembly protein CpaC